MKYWFQPAIAAGCLAVALLGSVAGAHAAVITWSTPTNETGNASDIITYGSFVGSAYVGDTTTDNADVTINGVTFSKQLANDGTVGGADSFADSSPITVYNMNVQGYTFNSAPGGWNSAYRTLTSGDDLSSNSNDPYIQIAGLTVGANYVIQILMPYWNANWSTEYCDSQNNCSGYLNLGAGGTTAQYVTGTFTADATSEDIYLSGNTAGGPFFGAMQVRETPEPATLLLLGGPVLLMGVLKRRRGSARGAAGRPGA